MHSQSSDESLTLPQAVKAAGGKISHHQLWRGIRAGRIEARQPSGEYGHYTIQRSELERVCAPTTGQK